MEERVGIMMLACPHCVTIGFTMLLTFGLPLVLLARVLFGKFKGCSCNHKEKKG